MISAILYTSATGFTRRYAALLGERTGLPVWELGREEPPRGTPVLYLGWMFAGTVKGLAKARRRWDVRGVCAVGMAPAEMAAGLEEKLGLGDLPFFYLRGGYAPEKLTGISRPMMWMMTRKITAQPPKDQGEAAMQEVFRRGGDFVEEKNLDPVLAWLAAGR